MKLAYDFWGHGPARPQVSNDTGKAGHWRTNAGLLSRPYGPGRALGRLHGCIAHIASSCNTTPRRGNGEYEQAMTRHDSAKPFASREPIARTSCVAVAKQNASANLHGALAAAVRPAGAQR